MQAIILLNLSSRNRIAVISQFALVPNTNSQTAKILMIGCIIKFRFPFNDTGLHLSDALQLERKMPGWWLLNIRSYGNMPFWVALARKFREWDALFKKRFLNRCVIYVKNSDNAQVWDIKRFPNCFVVLALVMNHI